MFGNLIKITSEKCDGSNLIANNTKPLTFIEIKAVDEENFEGFLKDLVTLIEIIDDVVASFYHFELGPKLQKTFETLVEELNDRKLKLNYLRSFFTTTTERIEAIKKTIEDQQRKIKENKEKKLRIQQHISRLREKSTKRNLRMLRNEKFQSTSVLPTKTLRTRTSPNIDLHLRPLTDLFSEENDSNLMIFNDERNEE
ncbi:CLUMA_CG016451, isoform A [Clunio marinus]|uniref:CLUMA_CG016451, isoform A n=1 Tax=Clunio marinus TaxID=568069 RepID=A0A1J1IVJ5_9DIPT|nr:CLUMA_CG016451, isoform A [Clunio marinus]